MASADARLLLLFAGISGACGVAAGAWASHAGPSLLDAEGVRLAEIGVRFQLVHAAALLGTSALAAVWPGRLVRAAGLLFIAGTILFSGSLYLLAITGARGLGMLAPVGGLSFVAGWLALCLHAARK